MPRDRLPNPAERRPGPPPGSPSLARRTRSRWLLSALLAAACGAPAPQSAPSASAGGEAVASAAPTAPTTPVGPPESYLDARHTVVMQIDMARVRRSPLREDIASAVRSYRTWRTLLGRSGLDPVRDFDQVLVGSSGAVADQAVILVVHRLSGAQLRDVILRMAVDRGERPAWRSVQGFELTDWPVGSRPRVAVVVGPREVLLVHRDQLDQALQVAADHRARRTGDEVIEPRLAMEPGVMVASAGHSLEPMPSVATRAWVPQGVQWPTSYSFELVDDPASQAVRVHAQASFTDANAAAAAADYYRSQRDRYAGQVLVRAAGLDRALRGVRIEQQGPNLEVAASFTPQEMQRVLGLVALGQQMGS